MSRLKLDRRFLNWNNLLLTLLSTFLSLLQVSKFRALNSRMLAEELLDPLPFQDSPLYLFQLNRFLKGDFSFGDGAILEKTQSGFSAGSSFIFALWGTIGKLLNLNLLNTYTLMVFLSSSLLYFAIYILLITFGVTRKLATVQAIPVYVLAFGFNLGRPSPTQQTIWLAILGLTSVARLLQRISLRNAILVNVSLLILLMFNPIYSLAVFTFFLLSVIVLPEDKTRKLLILFPVAIAFLGFKLFELDGSTPEQVDQLNRFGVFHSRLPGAFVPSILLLIMGIFLWFLNKGYATKSKIVLSNLNFSIVLALNSQVLTNTNFEMQSHLRYLVNLTLLISGICLVNEFYQYYSSNVSKKFKNGVATLIGLSVILIAVNLTAPNLNFEKNLKMNKNVSSLIHNLNRKEYSGKVFVVPPENVGINEISYLALNSSIKLYWYPESVYSVISDRELFERFACTLNEDIDKDTIKKYEDFLFAHKYINREQFYTKWNLFLGRVGLKTKWRSDKNLGYDNAENLIVKFQKICKAGRYSKKADYFIDKNLIIRDISLR